MIKQEIALCESVDASDQSSLWPNKTRDSASGCDPYISFVEDEC